MHSHGFWWTRVRWLLVLALLIGNCKTLARSAAAAEWPEAGVGKIPASVETVSIAFDGWGGDVLDPWQYLGTGLLQSYLNLRLMHRDENMQIVPLWATEWKQTEEGVFLTLDPKAT